MNITIFAAVDFPTGPATTSRIKYMAKTLSLAGNKVTVASLQANSKIPCPGNRLTEGDYDNIRYTYLSGNLVRPSGLLSAVVDSFKGCFGALALLARLKRERSIDLVVYYTPDFFAILPSLVFAKLCGLPVVLELCEVNSARVAENFKQRVRHLGSGLTDTFLPRICSGVIVISTKIREKLLADGMPGQKIFHLPILADTCEFTATSSSSVPLLAGKKYFLNSGALGEKDGCDHLLEAFALLRREHKDVYLVFTGEPDQRRKRHVVNLTKKLGIEEQVLFTGFLPNDQLVWSYQHATGLLCCRNNSRFAHYGSPNKLSEYLSTGTPVITNEIGDTGSYLTRGHHAFFARVEDHESIAEQMLLVMNQPELAANVGREGQLMARKYFHYENYVTSLDAFVKASCRVA